MAELEYFPDLPDARIFKEVNSRNKSTVGGYIIYTNTHTLVNVLKRTYTYAHGQHMNI